MDSMRGKQVIITGATSGIGKATALGLAKLGATVVIVARDRGRGEAARSEIVAASGNSCVEVLVADLSAQQSIRQLAADSKAKYQHLHVLINNAGVSPARRSVTVDGIETTFAVNHLAPFLLTHLLLDVLKASAPARVVNVTSSGHARSINLDDLQLERSFSMMRAYSESKLENILFTYELARRLTGTGVTANCVHPGVVRTQLDRDMTGFFRLLAMLIRPFMVTPAIGAETSIYVATAPELEGVSGKYFVKKQARSSASISYDEAIAQKLWQISAKLTGLKVS